MSFLRKLSLFLFTLLSLGLLYSPKSALAVVDSRCKNLDIPIYLNGKCVMCTSTNKGSCSANEVCSSTNTCVVPITTCTTLPTVSKVSSSDDAAHNKVTYNLRLVGGCTTSKQYQLAANYPSGWTTAFNQTSYTASKTSPVSLLTLVVTHPANSYGTVNVRLKGSTINLLSLTTAQTPPAPYGVSVFIDKNGNNAPDSGECMDKSFKVNAKTTQGGGDKTSSFNNATGANCMVSFTANSNINIVSLVNSSLPTGYSIKKTGYKTDTTFTWKTGNSTVTSINSSYLQTGHRTQTLVRFVLEKTTTNNCQKAYSVEVTDPANHNRVGAPGAEKSYTIKVTNGDTGNCPASDTFTLSKAVANNASGSWKAKLDDTSLPINKGASKITTLHVTSPAGAANGAIKTVTVTAKGTRTTEPHIQKTIHDITYTVQTSGGVTHGATSTLTLTPPSTTGTPPGATKLKFKIGIDGIGVTPRIPIGGNNNPVNPTRDLTVTILKAGDNSQAYKADSSFTYNTTSKKFETNVTLPATFNSGTYNVYVQGPRFLPTQYPGSVTITKDQQTNLTADNFYLITGNINDSNQSENRIDLLDYNVLISCWIYSQDSSVCEQSSNFAIYSDLNDDGQIDQDDFTLFLKEVANQQGVIIPDGVLTGN